MITIATDVSQGTGLDMLAFGGGRLEASATTRIAATSSVQETITLRTDQGDTVTLALEQSTAAIYGRDGRLAYQYMEGTDGNEYLSQARFASGESEWMAAMDTRQLTLTVEGDLNDSELRDIRKAIKDIDRMIRKNLFSEDIDLSADTAKKLARRDTLAEISVSISREQALFIEQHSSVSTAAYSSGGSLKPVPMETDEDAAKTIQDLAGQIADRVRQTGIAPGRFNGLMRQMFAAMRSDLARQFPDRLPLAHALENEVS